MTPHRFIHLAETGSTNKDAMRLALAGEALPLWVSADEQSAGRGRAGRNWVSIPGNLHASVAFETAAPAPMAGQVALVAGVMLYEAVVRTAGGGTSVGKLRLKWPNDLLIGVAKVAGILVETTVRAGGKSLVAVAGFGVNVTSAPEFLDRPVTSFANERIAVSAAEILAALAEEYDRWMTVWCAGGGFAAIREVWLARSGTPGDAITINTGAGPVSGRYQGLDHTGALLAEVGGKLEAITFGDVVLGNGA